MVRVQQLSELEEVRLEIQFPVLCEHFVFNHHCVRVSIGQVIDYCTLPVGNPVTEGRRALIRNMWTQRIHGVKRNVEVCACSLS